MRAAGAIAASLLAAVALAAALIGWMEAAAPLTADQAVEAAEEALRDAGVESAQVLPSASRGTYEEDDRDEIEVWRVVAEVEGGRVLLWLARDDGEPVFLDDRSPDGGEHLLSDRQFEALTEHDPEPRSDLLARNLALTAASAAVVVMAALLATAVPRPADERGR